MSEEEKTPNLNRCPFCGSVRAELVKDCFEGGPMQDVVEFWAVECDACNCVGPTASEKDKAVELWNKGMMRVEVDRIGH